MNPDKNTALYEKMAAEQDKFRDWLKSQPAAEVLNHAYEYTVREDILMAMEELGLPQSRAAALLASPSPLADVYARWAKVFNLKQMAQTLNYLSEHGLLDYVNLEAKTAEATVRYNALSDQIKAAEKRMAEIAVLRTHIVNYAKTRNTYVAYRKAGYSRKFRQEHEEEILLHQAAKEAFNELNVKKLPTIKELQTEYAQLLADKKKAYGEYRQARAAMRELLTVKNNVDRVLSFEAGKQIEKERDQKQNR